MTIKGKPIILAIICSLFVGTAQIALKKGANNLSFNITSLITNHYLIIGLALYTLGMILLLLALKEGKLNTTYPFIALSYIWVNIMAYFLLGEQLNELNWVGIAAIIGGISLIGVGSTT